MDDPPLPRRESIAACVNGGVDGGRHGGVDGGIHRGVHAGSVSTGRWATPPPKRDSIANRPTRHHQALRDVGTGMWGRTDSVSMCGSSSVVSARVCGHGQQKRARTSSGSPFFRESLLFHKLHLFFGESLLFRGVASTKESRLFRGARTCRPSSRNVSCTYRFTAMRPFSTRPRERATSDFTGRASG